MIFANTVELQKYLQSGRSRVYRLLEQGIITRLEDGRVVIDDAAALALRGRLSREEILRATAGMRRRELERWLALYEKATGHRVHLSTIYRWRKQGVRRKMTEWQQEALRLYLSPNQPTISSVARALQRHFTGISYWRIYRFLRDYERRNYDVVVLAREGERALRQRVLKYVERNPELLQAFDLWSADGHVLNVFATDGRRRFRPVLICFHDFATGRICGWEVWHSEKAEAVAAALFWGIIESQAVPRVVYLDNGRGFQSRVVQSVCEQLGIDVITAMPYNARAKKVERFFGTLDVQFSRALEAYTGRSAEEKPADYHRSEQFLRQLGGEREPIAIEALYDLLREYIDRYNEQIDQVLPPSARREIEINTILHLLPYRRARLYRNGFRWRGQFYWSEELYGLKTGEQYIIRWSLHFPDRVFVDLGDGEVIVAYRTEQHHPAAFILGDEKDQQRLQRELALQRALQKRTQQTLRRILGSDQKPKRRTEILPSEDKQKSPEDEGIILWVSDLFNKQENEK